ncbi:hypothetical protein BDA99DRAFT_517817 [Phascolomyces articulosus]|uniref:HMG box domain-containing protein n=1 Tax=Phascolomyces articulosus TaxID=60185 RepID=A0AAD5JUE5_9FUNG|nr:hypothetical protein BDA99DRAFT_517817 [Phascolomyces articulosus]
MANTSPTLSLLSFSSPNITLSPAPTLSPPSSSSHYTPTPSPTPSTSSQFEDLSISHQKDLDTLAKITDKRRSMRLRHRPPRKAQKKKDTGKIPRPMNCFMAYRVEKQKTITDLLPGANHRDISKIVAKWWREEPEHIKKKYRVLADKAKEEHSRQYPDYKYAPKRKRPYNNKRNNEGAMIPSLYLEEPCSSDSRAPSPLILCQPPSHHHHPSPYSYAQPYPDQHHPYPYPYHHQHQQGFQWSMLQPPSLYPDTHFLWNPNIDGATTPTATTPVASSIASVPSHHHDDPMFSSSNSMSNYCPSPSPPLMYDSATISAPTTSITSVLSHGYHHDHHATTGISNSATSETVGFGPNCMYYSDFILLDQD